MELYFIRHCEIESNLKKVYAGWSEEELTNRGIKQAQSIGKKLKEFEIYAIYCSPLKRTVQTAEIIGDFLGLEPDQEDSFKEMRLGVWEGLSEEMVSKYYPKEWKLWNTQPSELIMEGRETLQELLERVLMGIKKIRNRINNSSVLIVTHTAIIRVLLLYTEKMSFNLYRTIPIPYEKIFKINTHQLIKI